MLSLLLLPGEAERTCRSCGRFGRSGWEVGAAQSVCRAQGWRTEIRPRRDRAGVSRGRARICAVEALVALVERLAEALGTSRPHETVVQSGSGQRT
jgi:hypothetical protein